MGDPKKTHKHFVGPRKPWDKTRLDTERELKKTYGLKNKRELWKFQTFLRKKRYNARMLLALPLEERLKREKELLESLNRIGLLHGNATLDDVLSLTIEAILERRLQTLVWRKGLANTISQARQFITHGHIAVDGRKVSSPNYIVPRDLEKKIGYYGKEMILQGQPKKEKRSIKKEFEEVKPKEEGKETKTKGVEKKEREKAEKKETEKNEVKVVKSEEEKKKEAEIEKEGSIEKTKMKT